MDGGGLIDATKYITQVGQLRTMSRNNFGDVSETSVVTVSCLVYQEEDEQDQTNPAVTGKVRHFAILPKTATPQTGDHLSAVVDRFGNEILSDARILLVNDYHTWRYGRKFFRVTLDVDLG